MNAAPELTAAYPPPLDQLLRLGATDHAWPDYRALGVGPEQIPALIRMVGDRALHTADGESTEVWAPLHAWRTLAQLRAVEAIDPLLALLGEWDEDDWVVEELPRVFGMIGPPAIPALARFLAADTHSLYARSTAANGLVEIAQADPAAREKCVGILTGALEQFDEQDPELNGFLVSDLMDLDAVEAAPVMGRAFAADEVEVSIPGDWEDVQVELGLLAERTTPRPRYWNPPPRFRMRERVDADQQRLKAEARARAKAKARKAMAKKSRKTSRRRK